MNRAQAIEAAAKRIVRSLGGARRNGMLLLCDYPNDAIDACIALAHALTLPADEPVCQWTCTGDEWHTGCGNPEQRYCFGCGRRIEIVKPAQDGAE